MPIAGNPMAELPFVVPDLTMAQWHFFVFHTLYLFYMNHLRKNHPLLKTNKSACCGTGIFINL
ncbi:hypothetical protein A4R26_23110 [Niastella populi]|uniref:Uncharacterized protein n=1 Tax=Niastella populi TaxID=550983 RepID=A0A1V9FI11_9BACT|nr:hypothetical protein A4R26_23110 [Niastella populi]